MTTVTVRIGSDKIGYFIMNNQKFKTWKNRLDINSQKVMRSMTFCELILQQPRILEIPEFPEFPEFLEKFQTQELFEILDFHSVI